jgi:hypothetical protein
MLKVTLSGNSKSSNWKRIQCWRKASNCTAQLLPVWNWIPEHRRTQLINRQNRSRISDFSFKLSTCTWEDQRSKIEIGDRLHTYHMMLNQEKYLLWKPFGRRRYLKTSRRSGRFIPFTTLAPFHISSWLDISYKWPLNTIWKIKYSIEFMTLNANKA